MASDPITSWQIDGETVEIMRDFLLGAPKSLKMVIAAMKLKDGKVMTKLVSILKKQRLDFTN